MTRRAAYGTALAAALAALAGTAGCNSFGPRACTLIGCQDGLTVRLSSAMSTPFRVEVRVTSPTSQPVYVYDCQDPMPCAARGIFFPAFTAEQAFVTVVTATGSRTTEIHPIEYRVTQPNGAGCPPECRQATVTANVPG